MQSDREPTHARPWLHAALTTVGLTATLLTAVALGTGCGAQDDISHPQPDFPLIEPETVELHYDDQDLDDSRMFDALVEGEQALTFDDLEVRAAGLVGEDARTLKPMRDALLAGNNMLKSGVILLRRTAELGTYEAIGEDRGRWQVDGVNSIIVLTAERQPGAVAGERIAYLVTVRPRSTPDATPAVLIAGFFDFEGRDEGTGRQVGAGVLRYNYDAVPRTANVRREQGRGEVAFRVGPKGKGLSFFFKGFTPRGADSPLSGRYTFVRGPEGGGLFRFFVEGDLIEDLQGRERLRQSTAWDPSGAARSHIVVLSALLENRPVIEECWDRARKQVWTRSMPELADFPNDGDEQQCPFVESPQLPDDTPPGEDEVPVAPELP